MARPVSGAGDAGGEEAASSYTPFPGQSFLRQSPVLSLWLWPCVSPRALAATLRSLDLRMQLAESWKWVRQWLGPSVTGQRGQTKENKRALASCEEVNHCLEAGMG